MVRDGNARSAFAGLVVCLALGGSAMAATVEEPAKRRDVDLKYAIYFGGFKVLKLNVDLAFDGPRYDLEAAMKTQGIIASIFPWSLRANASGKMDAARVHPDKAHSENVWRGKKGWMTLRFDENGPMVVSSNSKRERVEVPPEELRDAVDVVSAILLLSRSVGAGQKCDTKLPVFDGKRRFDFVVDRLGEERLSRDRYSAFSGKALHCQVNMEMLHGRKRERDYGGFGSQGRKATIWIAPIFNGVPPMPVRLEYDTRWGLIIAHLARAKVSGDGRDQVLKPRR